MNFNMNHPSHISIFLTKDYNDTLYNLLLLADPSRKNIEKYISNSTVYVAELHGELIGCYVLFRINDSIIEIKSITVKEAFQGKGIGTKLLLDAIEKSKLAGFKNIIIGTGNSSFGQLYLYQKMGFRLSHIIPGFFEDHYDEVIWENGLQCRDMIVLSREI